MMGSTQLHNYKISIKIPFFLGDNILTFKKLIFPDNIRSLHKFFFKFNFKLFVQIFKRLCKIAIFKKKDMTTKTCYSKPSVLFDYDIFFYFYFYLKTYFN